MSRRSSHLPTARSRLQGLRQLSVEKLAILRHKLAEARSKVIVTPIADSSHSKQDGSTSSSEETPSKPSTASDSSQYVSSGPLPERLSTQVGETYLHPQFAKGRYLLSGYYSPTSILTLPGYATGYRERDVKTDSARPGGSSTPRVRKYDVPALEGCRCQWRLLDGSRIHSMSLEVIPLFVYKLSENCWDILYTDKFMFITNRERNTVTVVSCVLAESRLDGDTDYNPDSIVETFTFPESEEVLAIYKNSGLSRCSETKRASSKHKNSQQSATFTLPKDIKDINIDAPPVDLCLIVTSAGIYEITLRSNGVSVNAPLGGGGNVAMKFVATVQQGAPNCLGSALVISEPSNYMLRKPGQIETIDRRLVKTSKLGTRTSYLGRSVRVERLVDKLGTGSGQLDGSMRVERLVNKLGTGFGQLGRSVRFDILVNMLGTGSGQLGGLGIQPASEIFMELVLTYQELEKAEKIAVMFGLNLQELLELAGDLKLAAEEFPQAITLYKLSRDEVHGPGGIHRPITMVWWPLGGTPGLEEAKIVEASQGTHWRVSWQQRFNILVDLFTIHMTQLSNNMVREYALFNHIEVGVDGSVSVNTKLRSGNKHILLEKWESTHTLGEVGINTYSWRSGKSTHTPGEVGINSYSQRSGNQHILLEKWESTHTSGEVGINTYFWRSGNQLILLEKWESTHTPGEVGNQLILPEKWESTHTPGEVGIDT
uniref:Uncharacterized protein n=1 Tax=Timema bartmani TaxID=61472 RepID=A0A7R9ERG1_9NEOP|nr:unnamed protein product [Timema bartmani]